MRLHLIRHARPDVASGLCYGRTDLSVSEAEHRKALSALVPALPRQVPVFSSPLRRCSELAARLAASLASGAVVHDDRLAEMNFGAWEMCSWDDIPREAIDAWASDVSAYRPGGAESVLEVAQRVCRFLENLRAQNHQNVIVVCHAGTIRMLSACLRHDSPTAAAVEAAQAPHSIAYGELIVIDC